MKLKIHGNKKISGIVNISGSKNAVLPLMTCALLTDEVIVINNVPNISDVKMLMDLLKEAGVEIIYLEKKQRIILKRKEIRTNLNSANVHKIRASYYIMGGFVANRCNFKMNYPGGCAFTKRPIDYHIDAFKKVGYKIIEKDDNIYFFARKKISKKIYINLVKQSVGATINILFISVLKKGCTIIKNASLEPEVLQVVQLLKKMGAIININDANQIEIIGVKKLSGASITVIPDRMEAGSFMLLALATSQSDIYIKNVYIPHLKEVIKTIRQMGVMVNTNNGVIHIVKENTIKGVSKIISAYPAFPTDLQQILCVSCLSAINSSLIIDTIYPKRLSHVSEIKKANGNIEVNDGKIKISPSNIIANTFYAYDLRCGFACIVLGVMSDGISIIENAEVVLRGYENIIDKLKGLGINVEMI